MNRTRYLSAQEAAERLEVSLSTLYAYVSRGLVRSLPAGDDRRARLYDAEDVRRLIERKRLRRNPGQSAENALYWGAPLVESEITLIAGGHLYYRGRDAVELARTSTVEEVAALIWLGEEGGTLPAPGPRIAAGQAQGSGTLARFQSLLPLAGAEDLAAYDLRPEKVAESGARILHLLVALAGGDSDDEGGIAGRLQQGWVAENPRAAPLLGAALILCADHELNISSFTARCVASAGSTPYDVVIAGLAALQGTKHGGMTRRVEAFLRDAERPAGVRAAIGSRMARGESIPGFGHPLYPAGDPRGRALLDMVRDALPGAPATAVAWELVEEMEGAIGLRPTVDLGLVVLARALALPEGAPLTLFALGRTIGWIGHAIEQYRLDRLIRPRARYVGPPPEGRPGHRE